MKLNFLYNKKWRRLTVSLLLLGPLMLSVATQSVAEEIVVSNNGSDSSNEAQVQSSQTTNVNQSNQATVNNNVTSATTTGGNNTNSNSGNTNITTGNSTTDTSISNQNINTNVADNNNCNCTSPTNITISNNGSGSNNEVSSSNTNAAIVSQTNNATISNNIVVNANTGGNKANNNTGNVTIKTGDIHSDITVENKNINNSISFISSSQGAASILVSGNGSDSENEVTVENTNNVSIFVNNTVNLLNSIGLNLNTGGNSANRNDGNASIETGDIWSFVKIDNSNINSSFAHVDCDCEKENHNPPPNSPTPTPPPGPQQGGCQGNCGGGGSGGGTSTGGLASVSGVSTDGDVLPATGSYFLFLITLSSLIVFFMGWYLRFRSGVAPGKN